MPSSRFALSLTISLFAVFTFGAGTALAAPGNDDFASPSTLDSGGNNGDIVQNSLITDATKQASEPEPTGVPTYDRTVWHTWTAPTSGTVSIDTCGTPGTETVLSFYTGNAINSLTKVVADAVFGCGSGNGGSKMTASIVQGTVYRIRIAGFDLQASGTVNMKVRTTPYNLSAPTLTGTPTVGQTLSTNGGSWFGAFPQTKAYTWLTCTDTTIGSCTQIATFANDGYVLQPADVGSYIRVSVSTGNTVGNAASASVSGPVGAVAPAPPSNDNLANATDLGSSVDVFQSATNAGASFESGEPMPFSNASASVNSVWFKWTAPASGPAVFSTCLTGIPFDAVMAVYSSSGAGFGGLNKVGEDDDGCSLFAGMSTSRIKVTGGSTYWIQVASFSSTTVPGPFTLTIALGPANDDFADAIDLGSGGGVTANSSNYNATREIGETDPFSSDNIHTIWFKWTAPVTGNTRFDTCSSPPGFEGQAGHDGVMAVYSQPGSEIDDLTKLGSDDDGCDGIGSMPSETLSVVSGTTYWIQIGKRSSSFGFGPPGPITLKIGTRPVNVTPPQVTGNLNVGQTLTAAQGVWAGLQPIDFSGTGIWFRCVDEFTCDPIPGASDASYTLTAADLGKELIYSEFPSNNLGNATAAAQARIGPIAAELPAPPVLKPSVDPLSILVPRIKASKLKVKAKKSSFTIPKTTVTCAASATGACQGTAKLTVKVKKKTIKLGTIKLSFKAGSKGSIKLKLSKSSAKKLKGVKNGAASAVLSIGAPGFAKKTATVKFTLSG